ncbi:DoxX family protein [Lysobacter sp. A286]
MNNTALLTGRTGLALVFILSGVTKIGGYAATQNYMDSMGIAGGLLPLVILLEVGGGLAVLAGLFTRWAALALGAFSLASGFLFHLDLGDANQFNNLFKNIAIAGGFLLLTTQGAGDYSLDRVLRLARTRSPARA